MLLEWFAALTTADMSRMKRYLFLPPIVSCLIYSQVSSENNYDLRIIHFLCVIVVVCHCRVCYYFITVS